MIRKGLVISLVLLLTINVLGCEYLSPGLSDRDLYVVITPKYSENRVYYVPNKNEIKSKIDCPQIDSDSNAVTLVPEFNTASDYLGEGDTVEHGSPLTIIVNSVGLPKKQNNDSFHQTMDIAVILDVSSASSGENISYVVWYQRGVKPDQTLNFSNLVVHHEPMWDSRVAPFFRIRVLDVATERNKEVKLMLQTIGNAAGSIGLLLGHPEISPIAQISSNLAGLLLGNKQNEMLLDYSVQFFSQKHIAQSGGAGLGSLRKGSFIVFGLPLEYEKDGREFWKKNFIYNKLTKSVYIKSSATLVESPFISVTVATAETVVPKLVYERTSTLLKLLSTPNKGLWVEDVVYQANALNNSLTAFAANEMLKKYRRWEDLDRLVDLITEEGPDGDPKLQSGDLIYLYATLNQIARNSEHPEKLNSIKDVTDWWAKYNGFKFDSTNFKLVE